MEQKLLDGLKDLGYCGPLLEKASFDSALQEGAKNVEFTKLVSFLTNELRALLNIDEEVNPISGPEDSVSFVMEVSSFLKELNCPYVALTQGHISDRLESHQDKLLLLDYLATELMAARVLQEKKPDKKFELKLVSKTKRNFQIVDKVLQQETEEAANMRKILMTLRFHKPPPNITIPQLFQKVCPTVQSIVQKVGSELVGKPAFQGTLSDKQWETLNGVQKDLNNEYKIRREMLLTRLDVTIQSFQWSDKTKGKDELFEKVYTEKRKRLKTEPEVELADLLAARDDIAIIEKTSNSSVRKNTKSSLNKVIIGQVPDRGGRTSEQAPPPPEMPSWQQRTPGPSGGGRGRGGGNFSRNDNRQNYSRDSGSYGGSYSGSYSTSYEQNSKRPKTYDSFQQNRTTYADQYVQEEQHNQQYHGRGNYRGRGRGHSNYNRGGRNHY
ncbi:protein FAM98A isoform X4 [Tribolium castaneum]|uniref:protein FAM98A isoform X4 n=1 Tax=Tribolium castaneum TaxID=7070 RepID=UPI0030FE14C3